MEDKLDRILSEIVEIKLDLREHMLRTEQNEKLIAHLDTTITPISKAYTGIKWTATALIAAASIVSAVYKFKL